MSDTHKAEFIKTEVGRFRDFIWSKLNVHLTDEVDNFLIDHFHIDFCCIYDQRILLLDIPDWRDATVIWGECETGAFIISRYKRHKYTPDLTQTLLFNSSNGTIFSTFCPQNPSIKLTYMLNPDNDKFELDEVSKAVLNGHHEPHTLTSEEVVNRLILPPVVQESIHA